MKLIGKAKELFREYYDNLPKHTPNDIPYSTFMGISESMQFGVYQDWADSIWIFIHIEPYIGGGDLVFYVTVTWRNKDFIDEFWQDRFNDGEPRHYKTRQEARNAAIAKLNELINEK